MTDAEMMQQQFNEFFEDFMRVIVRKQIIEPLFSNQRPGEFDKRKLRRRVRQLLGKQAGRNL